MRVTVDYQKSYYMKLMHDYNEHKLVTHFNTVEQMKI